MADIATIGILQERSVSESLHKTSGLQNALKSRVAIEQAKGILAERWSTGVDDAFDALRRHARSHRLGLTQVCRQLIDGRLDTEAIDRP
jgi:AmiR/NasT family two-component response regulator